MEPDFDKEIDALLRKETAGRTITISEFAGGLHLDADEITAFAEKKVPPGVRGVFIEHFAACDRCRKVLLNAAWLNAEEETAEQASVAAPAETALPWYRRLFLFPNLAYVMGGLIVLFGGFIGFSVYNGLNNSMSEVSQTRSAEPAPTSAPAMPSFAANTNSAANLASPSGTTTSVSNTVANAAAGNVDRQQAEIVTEATPEARAASPTKDRDLAKSQQPALAAPAAAPPPPKPRDEAYTTDGVITQRKVQDLPTVGRSAAKERERDDAKVLAEAKPAPSSRALRVKPPPGKQLPDATTSGGSSELKKANAANSAVAGRKQVQGRTFEFRRGAWYDLSYRGQGTVNVRRNTAEYNKLDLGLRGLAESFVGTVVTIWNGRAYKIQ